MAALPDTVTFWFDPGCRWTWSTHQWLLPAAQRAGVDVRYRSLSLAVLNAGREVPDRARAGVEAGKRAHRVFAALLAAGHEDLVGPLYVELGRRVFHDGERPTPELLGAACAAAGIPPDVAAAADDASLDAAVTTSTHEAMELAGPDVGSPVLSWGSPTVAIFGPIVSPPPTGEEGARLLELVVGAAGTAGFFELKRGRRTPPDPGERP